MGKSAQAIWEWTQTELGLVIKDYVYITKYNIDISKPVSTT